MLIRNVEIAASKEIARGHIYYVFDPKKKNFIFVETNTSQLSFEFHAQQKECFKAKCGRDH